MRRILLPALLVAGMQAKAQAPAPQPDAAALERKMCTEPKCQHDVRVVLKQKDGTIFDRTFAVFPATVQDFGVAILAGQTVYLEATRDGNRLVGYTAVDRVADVKTTITAKLEQVNDGGMMLTVHNPFDKPLKFDMGMMPLDAEDLYKTSSCPVIAGGASFEAWPHPIFQVVLRNGRLLEAGDSMACVK